MTQQTVSKLLEKEKKWMSSKQIAKKLGIHVGSVKKNLSGLYAGNFVEMKVILNKNGRDESYYKLK